MSLHRFSAKTSPAIAVPTEANPISQKMAKLFQFLKPDLGVLSSRSPPPKFHSSFDHSSFDTTAAPRPSFARNTSYANISSPRRTANPPNLPRSIAPRVRKSTTPATITSTIDHQHPVSRDSRFAVRTLAIRNKSPKKSPQTPPILSDPEGFRSVNIPVAKKADLTVVRAEANQTAPSSESDDTGHSGPSAHFYAVQGNAIFRDEKTDLQDCASRYLQTKLRKIWLQGKPMDDRSYGKIAHLQQITLYANTKKFSTAHGLHGASGLGQGARSNGFSYGKFRATPTGATCKNTTRDYEVTRISLSASKRTPLHAIIATLDQHFLEKTAAYSQDDSYSTTHPSNIPTSGGRRSAHQRMGADIDGAHNTSHSKAAYIPINPSSNRPSTSPVVNKPSSITANGRAARRHSSHSRTVGAGLNPYHEYLCDDEGCPVESLNWI